MLVKISTFSKLIFNLVAFFGFLLFYVHFTLRTSVFITEKFFSHQNTRLVSLEDHFSRQDKNVRGKFAVQEWNNLCRGSLQHMFMSTVFPKYPDAVHLVDKSTVRSKSENSGRRISGYLHVPVTGLYTFLLKSSGESELWISESEHHKDAKLAASVETKNKDRGPATGHKFQYSREIFLDENMSHPFEVFHFGGILEVYWIQPGKSEFEIIEESYISHDTRSLGHEGLSFMFFEDKNKKLADKTVFEFSLVSFISPQWVKEKAISECSFDFKDKTMARKRSKFEESKTNVEMMFSDQDGKELEKWKENPEIKQLIEFYMQGLERIYPLRFKPSRVYKVEKLSLSTNHEPLYLMEIELKVDGLDYPERAVEYIYRPNATHFCYPQGLTWNKDAFMNIVVLVKNETKWLKLFIDRLEKAFERTLEVDMHLIVVDFKETGLNIESILDKTTLKDRFTVTNMDGPYLRSRGLNRGASLAKGKHPIILAYDVHVDIPETIFEDTRKHCVEGQIAFAPVTLHLDCSSHPGITNPSGSWCFHGYEVIGIYKSDWIRTSGMDDTLAEQKADWDLISRIRNSGLSVARFKYPGLYRHYMPATDDGKLKYIDQYDINLGYFKKDI